MGMGLSVSRSIVESHHGRIWVSANVGPGAMFSFSLPCAPKNGHPRYIEERTLNNVQSVTRDL
jgi:signal transduction histidine kinase